MRLSYPRRLADLSRLRFVPPRDREHESRFSVIPFIPRS
jgi:hypothetical protein